MRQSNIERNQLTSRASATGRKQRDGPDYVGGYGQKTGSSDLLFLEGHLPTVDGTVDDRQSAPEQLERCLENLRETLEGYDRTLDDVLKVTVYLTDLQQYEAINDVYRDAFDEQVPARSVVGVSELLGGADVQLDAVVAVE
ncbi:RidA family protein [Natronorubrum aibiense]|uniref:RidA family protein n=1 Tax=Natronorubrum aibiense TaxID=348826 RepID=A0A5P9P918_9EURY|nr:RidA family protein [Natronorubrum aibiense]QFU84651.1 RidA family protein [Natronorubrum aibiense]